MVAPTTFIRPRASSGLIMLDTSICPSCPPAPTIMCNSSINTIISPLVSITCLIKFLSLSSNCPRNIAPATIALRSSAINSLFLIFSGTSPSTMRLARPSTTVVFPVPGSPISTGLFLVRRDKIWTIRRISSSRPITGSIFPSLASCVRLTPYFSTALMPCSGFICCT